MENPVKAIRKALGLSQQKLAEAVGMSVASIRAWEAGVTPSRQAIERLKSYAAEQRVSHLATRLDPAAYVPIKIFGPENEGQKLRLPKDQGGMAEMLHAALDQILASGRADVIVAVESVIQLAITSLERSTSASNPRNSGAH